MKSNTRLLSAVFNLTPTRTRCDLIIIANEKKEKVASGLLNPFLAHLKTAQEQIEKGGYSIVLEPEVNSDAAWFTKGTVERFVRFVSTPEIMERVYTIESEILQIEEAISIQGTNDLDHTAVNDNQAKPMGSHEGNKLIPDHTNEEKAIVLYKPGVHQPESNQQLSSEGNSKVQLLKVLETRKIVLQKEQGMAFARAVAAGFDIDHMAPLLSFAECFGAARLMDACTRFMDLWRKKHENGQWLEIEAPETMSNQSEFSAMSASGIMLASVANNQNGSRNDVASDNNGKFGMNTNAGERPPIDSQVPSGQNEYFQGQFPHPMFAPWPMHSPPGTVPVFPAYPVQGMPYYQSYPGNGPFYHPPYPANGDSRYDVDHKTGKRRQSMDDKDSDSESERSEMANSRARSQDDTELIKQSRKKAGRSNKKKSGLVVIRNINYITSKTKDSASTESESTSGSESDAVSEEFHDNGPDLIHKNSSRLSNRKERHAGSMDEPNLYNKEETMKGKDSDGGHWQAFQNLLLRVADEENCDSKEGMFAPEKEVKMKRRQSIMSDDPLVLGGRDLDDTKNKRNSEIHEVSGTMSRRIMQSTDEVLLSGESYDDARRLNYKTDMQSTETNGRRVISRTAGDDFVIGSRGDRSDMGNLSDPLAVNGFERATNKFARETTHDMADESFIVPFRSMSLEEVRPEDRTINMDSELPSSHGKSEDIQTGIRSQANYEPDALSLMPERGTERRPIGYDPALDYEIEGTVEGSSAQEKRKKEVTDVKEESKKSEKERKSKVASGNLDKKRTGGPGPIRKEKPSKMGLLEDARARAERLRSYKADIQKMKKEKEEEDLKRIEALKLERQKRIAARASSASAHTPGSSTQTRKLPTKLSPISQRGSKFSDSEPGASSPLQRSKIRTTSLGSSDSQKASKGSKVSSSIHMAGNRLTRSVSSLSEPKKETSGAKPDSKASMARIRRLSEPKTVSNPVTATKARSAEPVMKQKLSDGPDSKKISAIVNLDKSKAATLPELKIRTSKGPSDIAQKKSAAKDSVKTNGAKSASNSEDAGSYMNNVKMSHDGDLDDNPIIEKNVVMLEYEKPFVPLLHQGGEKNETQNQHNDHHATMVKSEELPEYAVIRAAPSPVDVVDRNPVPSRVQVQSNSHEVRTNYGEKDSAKVPNSLNSTAEEPYQAPYARNSSLEDPGTRNLVYGLARPACSENGPTVEESAKVYVSDVKTFKMDKIPEASEKTQVKESSKGFRRLLKFGKKNHTSGTGDQSVDFDNSSVKSVELEDNKTSIASSSEVYTLKNLISQDETSPAGSASQKSSRHFSLFSPFRGKTSEKKLTT